MSLGGWRGVPQSQPRGYPIHSWGKAPQSQLRAGELQSWQGGTPVPGYTPAGTGVPPGWHWTTTPLGTGVPPCQDWGTPNWDWGTPSSQYWGTPSERSWDQRPGKEPGTGVSPGKSPGIRNLGNNLGLGYVPERNWTWDLDIGLGYLPPAWRDRQMWK